MNYLNNYLKKIFEIIRTNKEDTLKVIQIFYDQRVLQFRTY